MKFCYILSGVLSLNLLVINRRHELSNFFRSQTRQGALSDVSSAPGQQGKDTNNTDLQTLEAIKAPDVFVGQNPEAKALTQFVNNQFEMAANLYKERLEIRKRRKPNGQYSPRDGKRLSEPTFLAG